MLIGAWNISAKVITCTEDESLWLYDKLAIPNPKKRYVPSAPDKIALYNPLRRTLLAGFVPLLQKLGKEDGVQIDVLDKRTRTPEFTEDPNADLNWLRPYQLRAVYEAIDRTRGILNIVTAGGKTEIAIGLTRALPAVKWLFLSHRAHLMDQAAARYKERTGLVAECVGDSQWSSNAASASFVSATFQTLVASQKRRHPRFDELMKSRTGIIVDEAHTLPADTFSGVVNSCPAYFRFGISGTPLARGDKRSLLVIGALGPVICEIKAPELIASGALAAPNIRMIRHVNPGIMAADWKDAYERLVSRDDTRNRKIVDAVTTLPKPSMVFVKSIPHGRKLVKTLSAAGLRTRFVYGKTDLTGRKQACQDLLDGVIDVLVTSAIMNEGVDLPALASAVVAGAGSSVIATIQRVGRGLRVVDGKSTFELVDIHDDGCGCLTAAGEGHRKHWACARIADHAKERRLAYVRAKYSTVVV